jgi:photosystem II stability/assembly factor-like uncharacterized protein
MSFSQSDLNSGFSLCSLSGVNGVAVSNNNELYYSTNSGANWSLSTTIQNVLFVYIGISSTNAVAMGVNNINLAIEIYYSINSGVNWSSYTTGPFTGIQLISISGSISGSNVLCIIQDSNNIVSIFYSSNGGNTWNTSNISNISNAFYTGIDISGSNAIACIDNGTIYRILVSNNGGANFSQTSSLPDTGYSVNTVSISGSNALFAGIENTGGATDGGFIFKSTDGGSTWGTPAVSSVTDFYFSRSDINGAVGFVGGINNINNTVGIYSTNNSGTTWTFFTLPGTNIYIADISGSGINGLIGVEDGINAKLFYTVNSGTTWILSPTSLSINTINTVSLSNSNGIVGTNSGVYYSSTPLCYEANTLILVLENEEEVYKKVSELKVGDLVKTYKQGYKKVKLLRSFNYKPLDRDNELNLLYKHKENGVILTAGHSILVDDLTEEEEVNNLKYEFNQTIEDKKLLLACSSDKFEKIDDDLEYELHHFSLESDEPKAHYGVYITDGILSESCSEAALLRMF